MLIEYQDVAMKPQAIIQVDAVVVLKDGRRALVRSLMEGSRFISIEEIVSARDVAHVVKLEPA